MSMVSKTSCRHFSTQGSYYVFTHAWTKLHSEVMSSISATYECHYAWPLPKANSTTVRDLMVYTICEQPALVCRDSQSHSVDPSL